MSKAVLVLDEMPENCLQCQLAVRSYDSSAIFCSAAEKNVAQSWLDLAPAEWDPDFQKPEYCPLMEIPDGCHVATVADGGWEITP